MTNALTLPRRISDAVEEYNKKAERLPETLAEFEKRGKDTVAALSIGGTYGRERMDTGSIYEHTAKKNLLVSAWCNVFDGLNLAQVVTAKDKNLFAQALASPAPFTLENIRATFGHYIIDPRGNILRGLAEMFADLDPAYKSHEKVKIGVGGLPKRVIMPNVAGYGWGRDKLQNTLNALAVVMGRPMVGYHETDALLKDGDSMKLSHDVWLKKFANGNGHLFFGSVALREINLALAEYYGDVLADTSSEAESKPGTALAKDLQYYPTPADVVQKMLHDMTLKGKYILEPSCGCGRILDAMREGGAQVYGVEYDEGRAAISRSKGHAVMQANFLEVQPSPKFDAVVMNPPFYGKHYAKHVRHALRFLKPDGYLVALLPATARYDHGLLEDLRPRWHDLPVGSFSESGTNINTTIATIFNRGA